TYTWTVHGKLSDVRPALLRACDTASFRWSVEKEVSSDDEMLILQCKGKGLPMGKRLAVIVAGQVTTDEVQVYAKFWDYVLANLNLSLTGLSEDSWTPVHPRFYNPPNQPGAAEQRRKQMADGFHAALEKQLR